MENEVCGPWNAKDSTSVYARLKAMASAWSFRPGERVNEVELARKLGVSRTPIREALGRIAAEGLLDTIANKGYTARVLDAREMQKLYEYRAVLEVGILRLVVQRASDAALADLARFAEQAQDQPETDAEAIHLLWLDEEFHERLASLSGNAELLRALQAVNERIRFPRWVSIRQKRAFAQNDHLQIALHLQARDLSVAWATLERHIDSRLEQIVELAKASFAEVYSGNALADYAQARYDMARK